MRKWYCKPNILITPIFEEDVLTVSNEYDNIGEFNERWIEEEKS